MNSGVPPDKVLEAFFCPDDASHVRTACLLLSLLDPEIFAKARERIDHETTIGPMLNPTAYLDGQRWDNAEQFKKLFSALESVSRLSKGGGT